MTCAVRKYGATSVPLSLYRMKLTVPILSTTVYPPRITLGIIFFTTALCKSKLITCCNRKIMTWAGFEPATFTIRKYSATTVLLDFYGTELTLPTFAIICHIVLNLSWYTDEEQQPLFIKLF